MYVEGLKQIGVRNQVVARCRRDLLEHPEMHPHFHPQHVLNANRFDYGYKQYREVQERKKKQQLMSAADDDYDYA